MSYTDWKISGPEFSSCNCDYGCPCQFNALPTYGNCEAAVSMEIKSGHFGETDLTGLRWVCTLAWPGPIHEGNGRCQAFVDERANDQQREALLTILSGQETAPGGTIFQVFSGTITDMLEPQFVPIEFSIDIEQRKAKTVIPGVLEATGEPILNPITNEPHRVRVTLPEGFEYTEAEYGSGSISAQGDIKVTTSGKHAHVCQINMTQNGVIH